MELLNEQNFWLYCAKMYNSNYYTSTEDLTNDLKRIGYIRKLLTRYISTGELKPQLILNHLRVLKNCFGTIAATKIVFFRLEDLMMYLKPFMIYLDMLPEHIHNVGTVRTINTDMIPMDLAIVDALRKINKCS